MDEKLWIYLEVRPRLCSVNAYIPKCKEGKNTVLVSNEGNLISVKGQLISEWIFEVKNFPKKNNEKLWQISTPEFKKWSNHKIKAPWHFFISEKLVLLGLKMPL